MPDRRLFDALRIAKLRQFLTQLILWIKIIPTLRKIYRLASRGVVKNRIVLLEPPQYILTRFADYCFFGLLCYGFFIFLLLS